MLQIKHWPVGSNFAGEIKEKLKGKDFLYLASKATCKHRPMREWKDTLCCPVPLSQLYFVNPEQVHYDCLVIENFYFKNTQSRVYGLVKKLVKDFLAANKDVYIRVEAMTIVDTFVMDEFVNEVQKKKASKKNYDFKDFCEQYMKPYTADFSAVEMKMAASLAENQIQSYSKADVKVIEKRKSEFTHYVKDGSWNLAIIDGKLEHIFGLAMPGKRRRVKIIKQFDEKCLPYDDSSKGVGEIENKKNDTIVQDEKGTIIFTQYHFLAPIIHEFVEVDFQRS